MPNAIPPSAHTARQEHQQSERLDNFVDGAFAFAITLLVISGASLPRTVGALVEALRGVPAFAVCFSQLALFWYGHVRWRETFRLTDGRSLLLSLLLVFFALIFVFPLHLVYASFFSNFSNGVLSPDFAQGASDVSPHSMAVLFVCYGLSYACMGATLAALFAHGVRSDVRLTGNDAIDARVQVMFWAYFAAVGLLSAVVALIVGISGIGWLIAVAGFTYALLALTGVVLTAYSKRLHARLPR